MPPSKIVRTCENQNYTARVNGEREKGKGEKGERSVTRPRDRWPVTQLGMRTVAGRIQNGSRIRLFIFNPVCVFRGKNTECSWEKENQGFDSGKAKSDKKSAVIDLLGSASLLSTLFCATRTDYIPSINFLFLLLCIRLRGSFEPFWKSWKKISVNPNTSSF